MCFTQKLNKKTTSTSTLEAIMCNDGSTFTLTTVNGVDANSLISNHVCFGQN